MSTANKTPNLSLPQYTGSDKFDLEEINKGYLDIDSAYKEIIDFREEIPKVNASAEIIEARDGEKKLYDKIKKIDSSLETKVSKNDLVLDIKNFGYKGDGVFDDALAIKSAIAYGETLIIGKQSSTGFFSGAVKILLPANTVYIKSKITCNNAFMFEGHGTGTTILIDCDVDYPFSVERVIGKSKTVNEENQIEGGGFVNVKFYDKRIHSLNSCIRLYGVDHMTLNNVYFYGIKGSCIEMQGARECSFSNIYTRFCGTTDRANIRIIKNSGGDTSNLNLGTNWNMVFPYGATIDFDEGNFTNINGMLIHEVFTGIYNSLQSHFGVNEFVLEGHDSIVLKNGAYCNITGLESVYCPSKRTYARLDNNSLLNINDTTLNGHYSQESYGDGSSFFNLTNNSTLIIGGRVTCNSAFNQADIFIKDSTSKIIGSLTGRTSPQRLNARVDKEIVATDIMLTSDRTSPVTIRPKVNQSSVLNSLGRIHYDIRTATDNVDGSIVQMGVDQYSKYPLFAIPDNTILRIPTCLDSNIDPIGKDNILWISSDGKLKVKIGGSIKTVTLS